METLLDLVNRAEVRRLEKAVKEKDRKYLKEWITQIANRISDYMSKEYEKKFEKKMETSMEHWIIALTYALHFSEEIKFGKKRLTRFMEDVLATTEGFRTGEYSPEEYKQQLKDDKIMIFEE